MPSSFSYTAPAPQYPWYHCLRPDRILQALIRLLLRLIFFVPRGLFFLLGSLFKCLGCASLARVCFFITGGVGSFILFAQHRETPKMGRYPWFATQFHRGMVHTHDGAHLETFEIVHPEQEQRPVCQQRFIIKMAGAASLAQDYLSQAYAPRLYQESQAREANIILFNSRGSGGSLGNGWQFYRANTLQDIFYDDVAQVERLLARCQASATNYPLIYLDCFSFGGARAARVVKYFQDQRGIKIFLEDMMSPANLAAYITAFAFPGFRSRHKAWVDWVKQPMAWGLWCCLTCLLRLHGWEVDTASDYTGIHHGRVGGGSGESIYRLHRNYRAQNKDRATESSIRDPWVSYPDASLHKSPAMRAERRAGKAAAKDVKAFKQRTAWRSKCQLARKYLETWTQTNTTLPIDFHQPPCEPVTEDVLTALKIHQTSPVFRADLLATRTGKALHDDALAFFNQAVSTHAHAMAQHGT